MYLAISGIRPLLIRRCALSSAGIVVSLNINNLGTKFISQTTV